MEYIDVVQKWCFFKEIILVTEEAIDTIDIWTAQEDETYKLFSQVLTYSDGLFVKIQIFCMTILAMNIMVTETDIEIDTEIGIVPTNMMIVIELMIVEMNWDKLHLDKI